MAASSLKSSSLIKQDIASSHFEIDVNDQYLRKQAKTVAMIDAARVGCTTLALLVGLTIMGLSGNAIYVYNSTRMADAGWLSIWPAFFDLRPTVALVAGSSIVTVANIAGLLCSKVPHVSPTVLDDLMTTANTGNKLSLFNRSATIHLSTRP